MSTATATRPVQVGDLVILQGRNRHGDKKLRTTLVNQRHLDIVARIRPVLLLLEANDLYITYGDLSILVDEDVHHQSWGPFLDVLSEDCERRGEACLAHRVVNSRTGLPGDGFVVAP